MKKSLPFHFLLITGLMVFFACKKDQFITSRDARLIVSVDTLRFDTVFTSTGSVTQGFKIFNPNDQKIRVDRIRLHGGSPSPFRMNVDGVSSTEATNLEIAANDSLYVFIAVTIDPDQSTLPFLVRDSIQISFNNNENNVQLEAYGQNARFLRNHVISGSVTWTNELPYVILGSIWIDTSAGLSIQKGTRIYFHADAPMIVDGTLNVYGTKTDSVLFTGDRLDREYRDLPASWPGIYFRESSHSNTLHYAVIRNAYQGLIADQPAGNGGTKLTLRECIIDNVYEAGLSGLNSSITASNCLITNCGVNILLMKGGDYSFTHCTVASYGTLYLPHKNPVLYLNNWDSTAGAVLTYDLNADFVNNIFWGDNGSVDDEVLVSKRGNNTFDVRFTNNLYRVVNEPEYSMLTNNLKNENPLFDSVNTASRYFDFHLNRFASPAINKGISTNISLDLDGKPRDNQPDLGSYEKQ